MPFQIHALPGHAFEDLFTLSDSDLKKIGALRVMADSKPGYPCRVSLKDAEIGDELILANYEHLSENSPYRASHGIYVRKGVAQATLAPDEIPDSLSTRMLSVRGFGDDHMMKDADVLDGRALAQTLDAFFSDPAIAYVHIHNARQGCFAAKATR